MNFLKGNINSSPFIGIFACCSEKFALVPHSTTNKKAEELGQSMGVSVVKTSIANSPLIGALAKIFDGKIAVPEIIEATEKKNLEKNGLEVKVFKGYNALGNLISLNKNGGVISPLLTKQNSQELEEFFGMRLVQKNIAGSPLAGSATAVTNKGFIVHPNITEPEFFELKKIFGVGGNPTTANFGDKFVGNCILANTKGALVGEITTSHEMGRIDEALRG